MRKSQHRPRNEWTWVLSREYVRDDTKLPKQPLCPTFHGPFVSLMFTVAQIENEIDNCVSMWATGMIDPNP